MNVSKVLFIIIFGIFSLNLISQEINNIRFDQKDNKIYIYYDLKDFGKNQTFDIEVFYSNNEGQNWKGPIKFVIGAVGYNQKSGNDKMIIWDVLKEVENLTGNLMFKLKVISHSPIKVKNKSTVSFHAGPILGLNFATIFGINDPSLSIGGNAGIVFNARFNQKNEIKLEFLYDSKGASYSEEINGYSEDMLFSLNYLSIPILYQTNISSLDFAYFEVGPYVGYLLNAKYDGNTNFTNVSNEVIPVKEMLNFFDFGFVLGFGGPVSNHIYLNMRYMQGLNDIDKQSDNITQFDGVNFGLYFNLYLLF